MERRGALRIAGVVALAALLAAAGVVYLVTECRNIPAPLPGRQAGSSDHRTGFAIASFLLAAVVLAAGSFGGRLRSRARIR